MLPAQPVDVIGSNRLKFRFVTQSRWITGELTSGHRRLVDVLNSEHTGILLAEQIRARFYLDITGTDEVAEVGEINTGVILFAVPVDEAPQPMLARDPMVWVRKRPERVRVGAGPYELTGVIFLPEEYRIRDVLPSLRDRFLAIKTVQVRRIDDLAFAEECDVAFVNRERLEYVLPVSER